MSINTSVVVVPVHVAGAVATGDQAPRVVLPFDAELVAVSSSVGVAPSAGALTIDVKKNGSTVYAGANATAAKSVIAQSATKGSVSKALATVSSTASQIGAGGAQYSPGTNNITPYTADPTPLATLTAATDDLIVNVSGTATSATALTVYLHFLKK